MILNQLRLLLGSFLTLCLTHFMTAQCLIPLTLEERVSNSEVIISGKIIGEESFWQDAEQRNIATACKVEVFRIFKGENVRDTLEIIVGGGRIGDKIQTTQPSPQFKLGDFVVLMCAPLPKKILKERPNCYYLTANIQSVIDCNLDTEIATDAWSIFPRFTESLFPKLEKWIGQPSVILKKGPLSITRPNTVASLRAKPIVRQMLPEKFGNTDEGFVEIKGSGFGTERGKGGYLSTGFGIFSLPFLFVDTSAKSVISWSDTLIRVPRATIYGNILGIRNNLGDTSNLDINAQLDNKYLRVQPDSITRLANVNNQGGYTIIYGTDCSDGGIDFSIHPARWAFEAALGDWVKQTNFNVRIGNALDAKTPTSNTCRVRFDTNGNSLQDYFGGGALGVCNFSTTLCANKLPTLENFDIVFQRSDGKNALNKISWDYCTKVKPAQVFGDRTFSFRTVALHELGHGLGFDHILDQKRIMYAYASDKMTGLLYDEDIEGARYIRQKSDQLTCKKPMNNAIVIPKMRAGCGETEALAFFQGRYDPSVIVINGQLLAVINAVNIQIEHSQNKRCFDSIGIISTKSLGTNLFVFTDANISGSTVWYYRLRFTFADGSFTFSEVITVNLTERDKKISTAPNPFEDRLSIRLDFLYASTVEAWFYDLSGRLVSQQKAESNGRKTLELDTKFLLAGMYILHLRTERDIIYKGKVCKM
jgi:hypothetical protein